MHLVNASQIKLWKIIDLFHQREYLLIAKHYGEFGTQKTVASQHLFIMAIIKLKKNANFISTFITKNISINQLTLNNNTACT